MSVFAVVAPASFGLFFLVSSRQHGAEAWPGTPQTRMLKAPSVTLGTTGRFDFNS